MECSECFGIQIEKHHTVDLRLVQSPPLITPPPCHKPFQARPTFGRKYIAITHRASAPPPASSLQPGPNSFLPWRSSGLGWHRVPWRTAGTLFLASRPPPHPHPPRPDGGVYMGSNGWKGWGEGGCPPAAFPPPASHLFPPPPGPCFELG